MTLSPLRPDDPPVVGGLTLSARLGSGGMGTVYLAADAAGRPLAVKLIREELAGDAEFRARFRREVQAVEAVGGRFVARLIAADPEAARPWLATEYVPGPSLADVVAIEGPLPRPMVAALAAGLAEALASIHAAGVVHRDVKPQNVLITEAGPKLIDFGIAVGAGASSLTRPGFAFGSPGYMAPEQVGLAPVGPPADVFGWGLTVAFASTGRPPFGGGQAEALAFRAIHGEPDLDGVAPPLAAAVRDAVRKAPAERPSAPELLRRLLPAGGADAMAATTTLLDESWKAPAWTVTDPVPAGSTASSPWRRRLLVGGLATVVAVAATVGGVLAAGRRDPDTAPPTTLTSRAAPPAEGQPAGTPGGTAGGSGGIAPATVTSTTLAPTAPVLGRWRGVYYCNQGETGVTLAIKAAGGDRLTAVFDLYPLARNPDVPRGRFTMRGSYTGRRLLLDGSRWIRRPADYEMVNIVAEIPDERDLRRINGTLTSLYPGCGGITLTRIGR